MTNESIKIILNQYKSSNITEDEAIELINDLINSNRWIYSPNITPWPTVTYKDIPKFEVTCEI